MHFELSWYAGNPFAEIILHHRCLCLHQSTYIQGRSNHGNIKQLSTNHTLIVPKEWPVALQKIYIPFMRYSQLDSLSDQVFMVLFQKQLFACFKRYIWVFNHLTSVLVQTEKTVFSKFYSKFCFAFFQLFSTKNTENDYFDQLLGKTWSKYTKWGQYNDHLKTKSSHFAWDLSDQKCCEMAQIVKRQIVEWEVPGSNLGRG